MTRPPRTLRTVAGRRGRVTFLLPAGFAVFAGFFVGVFAFFGFGVRFVTFFVTAFIGDGILLVMLITGVDGELSPLFPVCPIAAIVAWSPLIAVSRLALGSVVSLPLLPLSPPGAVVSDPSGLTILSPGESVVPASGTPAAGVVVAVAAVDDDDDAVLLRYHQMPPITAIAHAHAGSGPIFLVAAVLRSSRFMPVSRLPVTDFLPPAQPG